VSDHPTAPGRSGVDRRRNGAPDGTDTGRRTGGLGRPVDAPPGSRGRPPVPPVRPVPTGPRTTMAPFQAAVPGSAAPGQRDDLWSSSRPGRGQRVADRRAAGQREAERQEAAARQEAERQEAERQEAERLAVEQRAAEQRAAQQREAERQEAQRRVAARQQAQRREAERAEAERLEAERHAAAARAAEARARQRSAAAPDEAGPAPRSDDDRSAPWSTGPAGSRPGPPGAARPAGAAPPAGGPAYGDWTRPSRSGAGDDTGPGRCPVEPEEDYSSQRFARLRAGAPTDVTGTPEADGGARRPRARDDRPPSRVDHDDAPAGRDRAPAAGRGPVTDPGSGTAAVGGRDALRTERRAAEEERKKAAKSARAADRAAGVRRGGGPRRAVLGLVAVAVVALGVLGVYSFASPNTQQASSQTPASKTAGDTAALGTVPGVSDLPPLSTVPAPTSAAPATPVRVPVTVLNSTDITGLAASIAGKIKNGGWQTLQVGTYQNKDIATTTVYFTQGNEQQRQAALQLIQQFPQLHGPAARFFNVPPAAAGGLVVVATGDWKP